MRAYRNVALHRRVIVALSTGRSFRGILFEVRGPLLILKDAELIDGRDVIPVDGSVVIERERVEFVQVVA
jgi:small nuclear ribonucleoprotein (snRNP)-like protein